MVRTPVPPTRQLHITAPRAPCLVLPLVHWVGLDPVPPHPPIHHRPLHSKYSTVFLSLLTQAKVIKSFIYLNKSLSSSSFSPVDCITFSVSALRFCHHLPALPTVPTNRADRSPSGGGRTSLRPGPSLQATVPQEGPCYYEQQLHLQHVPTAASGQKLRISEQQGCCQSR